MTNLVRFPALGLEFELNRVAFSIGDFNFYWYGLLIAMGLLLAMAFAMRQAKDFGIDPDRMVDVIFIGVVAAIVCARAYYVAFAPFEYREGDKFCGIDMELAREIADELGMELVLEDMEFDSVVISVGKHGVDLGMAALTVNETRKKSVNFSSSYYNAAQVLVTLENDNTFQSCKTASDVLAILK